MRTKVMFNNSSNSSKFILTKNNDFHIYSREQVEKTSISHIKLRISVPKNQFKKAESIIQPLLISDDSPFDYFKVINMEYSERALRSHLTEAKGEEELKND